MKGKINESDSGSWIGNERGSGNESENGRKNEKGRGSVGGVLTFFFYPEFEKSYVLPEN